MRGRAALIGSLALVWTLSGAAQSRQQIPKSELEDQVLGWIKVYDYKGAAKPITVDTRVYSPAQLSIAQLFANWIQASCLPKGARLSSARLPSLCSATGHLKRKRPPFGWRRSHTGHAVFRARLRSAPCSR